MLIFLAGYYTEPDIGIFLVTFHLFSLLISRDIDMTIQEFNIFYSSIRSRLTAMVKQFSKAASISMDEDDIVQEAFIALWQLSVNGYPIRNAEALLVRITKNICSGQYRKLKNRARVPIKDTIPAKETASRSVESEDEKIIKQRLYETLTKTEREYMILKTDEEMSLDEMAELTGKGKPAVKTALSKARKKLMDAFKKNGYE